MCGIVGFFNLNGEPHSNTELVLKMASTLVHRGPDEAGVLLDGPIAFGFRRLSIIDLDTGTQPVSNENQTIWVMFNGEIYNFVELREVLTKQGHCFRTQSDTETIVHAYESYGLDFVKHLKGMFSIALWDANHKRLILTRDRLGKKPLFYSIQNKQLIFASELKALLQWPLLKRDINEKALHDYLTFLYVPSPDSILKETYKLSPSSMLVAACDQEEITIHTYWTQPLECDFSRTLDDFSEEIRELLTEAVRLRLRSDVPLGAFLSGGIDSTIIVGLMSQLEASIKTFNIGFSDKRFDESGIAAKVANFFGVNFQTECIDEYTLTPEELIQLAWYMDEPFADSSFIPSYWLARSARKQVVVALSGDGGDELFGGYTRYKTLRSLQKMAYIPKIFRQRAHSFSSFLQRFIPLTSSGISERLRQLEKALRISSLHLEEQMLALITYYDEGNKITLYRPDWLNQLNGYSSFFRFANQLPSSSVQPDPVAAFMWRDIQTNMVDDALVKVDRASMACSLEVRSPFLDHNVVECALQIPSRYKFHRGLSKFILRHAFRDLLPVEVQQRRKQGFEVPFAHWFQNTTWREFLLDMLSEKTLNTLGIFDAKEVLFLRDQMLANPDALKLPISAYQLRHRVWIILMFVCWYHGVMWNESKR